MLQLITTIDRSRRGLISVSGVLLKRSKLNVEENRSESTPLTPLDDESQAFRLHKGMHDQTE